ncbi:hypothetical protein AMJ40_03810 [candidate division TA06 bacterium DG_26]|uniref:DUF5658 domain-containing protein n=1 Tax=candidate division TA06 bacterium DG_26 TaxID=1703771 RepID=A0A0S7WIT3_UNCT6|nr:MAG: hypothetical protein AMJ40_03810 [candidate division TA06 bacterium DG_26]
MVESILFLLLVVLQLTDATLTELFYHRWGEGNPLMQAVIERTGFTGLYLVKGIVILGVLIIAYIAQMHHKYLPAVRFALLLGVLIEILAVGSWVFRFLFYLMSS